MLTPSRRSSDSHFGSRSCRLPHSSVCACHLLPSRDSANVEVLDRCFCLRSESPASLSDSGTRPIGLKFRQPMPARGLPVARRTLVTPRGTLYGCLAQVRRQSYCEQICLESSRARRLVVTCGGPAMLRQACPSGWCDLSTTMLLYRHRSKGSVLVNMRNYLNEDSCLQFQQPRKLLPTGQYLPSAIGHLGRVSRNGSLIPHRSRSSSSPSSAENRPCNSSPTMRGCKR
jgi:hypothetical protein